MKRSRFTVEQIIKILKEHEAGVPVADLCGQHGVSASMDRWKAKFGGKKNGGLGGAKRPKTLGTRKPPEAAAGGRRVNAALKDLLGQNG